VFGHYRLVATVEKFYDILERVHSTENGHVGYKKTLAEVWNYRIVSYVCYHYQATQTSSHQLALHVNHEN